MSCMKVPDDVASFWLGITERTINITKYSLCIIERGVHLASQVNNGEILGVHIFTHVILCECYIARVLLNHKVW